MAKINRQQVYDKYEGHCAYCAEKIELSKMQVDHIIPKRNFLFHIKNKHKVPLFLSHLTENDVDHIDNLMPSCKVCNNWKDVYDLETFRKEIFNQIERLNKYSASYRLAKRYGLIGEFPNDRITFYFEDIKANEEVILSF
jgi:5-methylcytosine-specific restriction endonuclease McrA